MHAECSGSESAGGVSKTACSCLACVFVVPPGKSEPSVPSDRLLSSSEASRACSRLLVVLPCLLMLPVLLTPPLLLPTAPAAGACLPRCTGCCPWALGVPASAGAWPWEPATVGPAAAECSPAMGLGLRAVCWLCCLSPPGDCCACSSDMLTGYLWMKVLLVLAILLSSAP